MSAWKLWPDVMVAGFAVNCRMRTWFGDEVETVVVAVPCRPSVLVTVSRKL